MYVSVNIYDIHIIYATIKITINVYRQLWEQLGVFNIPILWSKWYISQFLLTKNKNLIRFYVQILWDFSLQHLDTHIGILNFQKIHIFMITLFPHQISL